MRAVGVVVCDLDGTLLNSRGAISPRTRTVLRRVADAGSRLVLATARPVRDVRPLAADIGYQAIAICSNGAIVYDFGSERTVVSSPLAETSVRHLVKALTEISPHARFGAEQDLHMVLEDDFALAAEMSGGAHRVPSLADALDARGFLKVMLQLPGHATTYYQRCLDNVAQGTFEVTVSCPWFCEISAAGVTKASALRLLGERLGFRREETLAFGDMPNDLPMLEWSGRSVAVANAHPDVLATCDDVTRSNDDDGVAVYLEELLG
jgi:hypothetical protein